MLGLVKVAHYLLAIAAWLSASRTDGREYCSVCRYERIRLVALQMMDPVQVHHNA